MADALGEPRRVARQLAARAAAYERRFARDVTTVLALGRPEPTWAFQMTGPMFYGSYGELAAPGQPLVVLMPHFGCFVSGLFHLHRYAPRDRPLVALRRAGGPEQTGRLFARLGDAGPAVCLLNDDSAAAARAYAALRRGGVLFAFIDAPAARGEPATLFGLPALLADGPLRLGAVVGARATLLTVTEVSERRLEVALTDPVELTSDGVKEGVRWLARNLERAIGRAPAQWLNWIYLGELWKRGAERARTTTSTHSSRAA